MYISLLLSLFLLLLTSPHLSSSSSSSSTHNRRALHQPFFPLSAPPPSPPSFPKYPPSTTPFFPLYPSPPPPPATPASFPANISSFSPSPRPRPSTAKLASFVLLPLFAVACLLILAAAFLRHRRRRRRSHPDDKLAAPNSHPKPPLAAPGDEFLYSGTFVSSRGHSGDHSTAASAAVAPVRPVSPELRPLPPLSRKSRRNADISCSSDEEFYSPRDSSADKESSGDVPSSRRTFPAAAAAVEHCGSRSPTLSTLSYPSSHSASSLAPSSPVVLSPLSNCRSNSAHVSEIGFQAPPPPLPPPPPPRTPSPPNRKLPQTRVVDYYHNPTGVIGPPQMQPPPPPPPPPPPRTGYWESRVRMPNAQPPDLATTRSVGPKNSPAAVLPAELPENSCAGEMREETPRLKLKPLHWDKVRASSDRETVWDQLKSSSFKVNEEMIETLFVCNTIPKQTNKGHVLPSSNQENRVLDPKKSQNIAILLRALNVTKEEVCEALSEGNTESLGNELLETLLKMAPSKEEEIKLKEYKDDSPLKLGPAERFLKAVLDIPFAFKRVDAMLYIANFDSEVNYLKKSFETLEAACEELRSSRLFLKLLEAVLKTGNRMNVGTNRGDAHAFKLDTLLKLVDVKGTDGKTSLLHFVVQEITRTEGSRISAAKPLASKTQINSLDADREYKKLGLQAVAGLGSGLGNVKKAAAMDSDVLSSYVSKLAGGISKVSEVLRMNETQSLKETGQPFNEAMSRFLKKAENEIIKVQAQESVTLSLVKEVTEYFHGNSTKEEAHPFRIFLVVRDFLNVLDQVCKEVERINERSFVSSARRFPVPVNPTLPQVFPRFHALRAGSSDDESSSSS